MRVCVHVCLLCVPFSGLDFTYVAAAEIDTWKVGKFPSPTQACQCSRV